MNFKTSVDSESGRTEAMAISRPAMGSASHCPEPGSGGATMLQIALENGALLDVVELYRPETRPDLQLPLLAVGGCILR
jgi:hypothetical protein